MAAEDFLSNSSTFSNRPSATAEALSSAASLSGNAETPAQVHTGKATAQVPALLLRNHTPYEASLSGAQIIIEVDQHCRSI